MRREAATHLGALGIDIDVTEPLGNLSLGGQQLVEIARVVFSGASIIILDEPTSALSVPEAERLFAAMRELKARGTSLVFISHFLEDVLAVSDRVTVLKNSRKVATLPNERSDQAPPDRADDRPGRRRRWPRAMRRRHAAAAVDAPPVLEVEGLSLAGSFADVSFDARPARSSASSAISAPG